jgi:enterobactin synthetase component D
MGALGLPAGPVGRATGRAPQWPDHCIGSITHAQGLVAAAIGRAGELQGLGIDLELVDRVKPALHARLFTPQEFLEAGGTLNSREATLRFGAKEAVYKAVNPIVGRFIGFHEVEVVLLPEQGRFRMRYVGDHAPNRIMEAGEGWYCFHGPYVFSLFLIP